MFRAQMIQMHARTNDDDGEKMDGKTNNATRD